MKYTLLLFMAIISLQDTLWAQVRLPRLVSDSMVLQRDIRNRIWGWAGPGEKITVRFRNKSYSTTANQTGGWEVRLQPMKAGGPFDMTIKGSNEIILQNILIGDVWVCSGQSNMELSMERVKDKYPQIIRDAMNPMIRQFTVYTNHAFKAPLKDYPSGKWEGANTQSIFNFTAVGYFFARSLYEKYKIPIGLIRIAVGGSPAEAWLSEEALKAFPVHYKKGLPFKNDQFVDSILQSERDNLYQWYSRLWHRDTGMQQQPKWYENDYDAGNWKTMQVPGLWKEAGLKNTGVVWFRKEIHIPAHMTGVPARLLLGNIIDRDSVYINGTFAGTTGYQYPPRKYTVPAGVLKPGKNTIVIRVINGNGEGGFYRDKPYYLIAGDSINLEGPWKYRLGTEMPSTPPTVTFHYQPFSLYNSMVAPLLNYSIKGVIWYQGESNTGRPQEYLTLFPALIRNWREKWKQGDFPFLFVQLSNFMEARPQPSESNWALLREAQFKTLSLPNTAMAVTIDIGEWNDIHPLNKEDVGKRLALAAERVAYGKKEIVYSGPVYHSMQKKGNAVEISFSHTGSGLVAKGGALKQFAIAGRDKVFHWADAHITGNKVLVSSAAVSDPAYVRYAWADNPEGANLYNREGLPAVPFRTDE